MSDINIPLTVLEAMAKGTWDAERARLSEYTLGPWENLHPEVKKQKIDNARAAFEAMSDIVKRLRKEYTKPSCYGVPKIQIDAANEIERLRAALRDMEQEAENHHAENVSRADLGGSDMAQRKAKAIVSRSGVLLYKIKFIARAALEESNGN